MQATSEDSEGRRIGIFENSLEVPLVGGVVEAGVVVDAPPSLKPPKGEEAAADAVGVAVLAGAAVALSLFSAPVVPVGPAAGFAPKREKPPAGAGAPPPAPVVVPVEGVVVPDPDGAAAGARGFAGGFPKEKVVGGGFEAGVVLPEAELA